MLQTSTQLKNQIAQLDSEIADIQRSLPRLTATQDLLDAQAEVQNRLSVKGLLETRLQAAEASEKAAREKLERETASRRNRELEAEFQAEVQELQNDVNGFAELLDAKLELIAEKRQRLAMLSNEHVKNTRFLTGEQKVDLFQRLWRNSNDLIPAELTPLKDPHPSYRAAHFALTVALHEKYSGPLNINALLAAYNGVNHPMLTNSVPHAKND